MMSIWTRWLEPCLIGLSTSLQKIITVSQYSLPLITIVGTLSECWSIVVIFACRCLYYHSIGHQWEWERIDDHNLLFIYSCCLLIGKTHIWCWTSTTFSYGPTWIGWDTWTTLKVRALSCLWFFTAHPVSQSMDDLHLSSLSLRSYRSDLVFGCSFVCAASSHYVATGHFSPDVSLRQQRRWCRSRWPRRPRQCPPRHHLPLSTTRQCSYSPRRAGNTVPHKSLVSQTPQCTVRSMPVRLSPWPHQYKTPPPHPHNRALSNSFRVQCLLTNKVLNSRTTARSKHAVPRLLDRLARDAVQTARKEGYIKIASMLGYGQCSHSLEDQHPYWQYQC